MGREFHERKLHQEQEDLRYLLKRLKKMKEKNNMLEVGNLKLSITCKRGAIRRLINKIGDENG